MEEVQIGNVSHYLARQRVAVLLLKEPLRVGDRIHIVGRITDVGLTVESVEVDTHHMGFGYSGYQVAVKVSDWVREGDRVYLQSDV